MNCVCVGMAAMLLVLGPGCAERVALNEAPCPCADGWVCDKSAGEPGICVRAETDGGTDLADGGRRDGSWPWDISSTDVGTRKGTWKPLQQEIAKQIGVAGAAFGAEAIWGSGPSDVYLVGTDGGIVRFDGSSWKVVHVQTGLRGIWGSGPNAVFAVGDAGGPSIYEKRAAIVRFDGTTWQKMDSGAAGNLTAVWGSGPNDVFAVGASDAVGSCVVLHFDGKTWSPMPTPGCSVPLAAVWGSGPSDVFAAGGDLKQNGTSVILRYDGASWSIATQVPLPALNGLWGSGPKDVYAVGYGRTVVHYDGVGWKVVVSTGPGQTFRGVWGSGPNDVYAVNDTTAIWHHDGETWGLIPGPHGTGGSPLSAVWGSGPDDVWVAGPSVVWHLQ